VACGLFVACLWLVAYLWLVCGLWPICGLFVACGLFAACGFFRVDQLVAMLHSTVGGLEIYFFILQNLKKFLTNLETIKWLVLVSKRCLSLLLEYMKNVLIYVKEYEF
jgi:hypothetical protein